MGAVDRPPHRGGPCRTTDHSHIVGDFLDWLNGQGIVLARWGHETYIGADGKEWTGTEDRLIPDHKRIEARLAEWYGIDLDAVEEEKRAMLDAIQRSAT
jgi:hypothetical protein